MVDMTIMKLPYPAQEYMKGQEHENRWDWVITEYKNSTCTLTTYWYADQAFWKHNIKILGIKFDAIRSILRKKKASKVDNSWGFFIFPRNVEVLLMTIYQMNILPLPAHACLVCHRVWLVTVVMVDVVWSISIPVVMLWSDYWTFVIWLPEVFPRCSLGEA